MESFIEEGVAMLTLIIEVIGAIFVGIGCLLALIQYIKVQFNPKEKDFTRTSLTLARYLSLALEYFQIRALGIFSWIFQTFITSSKSRF